MRAKEVHEMFIDLDLYIFNLIITCKIDSSILVPKEVLVAITEFSRDIVGHFHLISRRFLQGFQRIIFHVLVLGRWRTFI